jgi:peptidylprolyl isomerase
MPAIPLPARLAALFLGVGLAASIAGCGSSSSGNSSSTSSTTEAQTSPAAAPVTPTSGPLSHEPTVAPPHGPAPHSLVVKDIIKGTGAVAAAGNHVTVNYVGALYSNGSVFDASWHRNEPFSFTLGQHEVIPGWEQGVAGMRVGGRRELIIPPALGYGASGSPPKIPPNETLIFVVDLLGA